MPNADGLPMRTGSRDHRPEVQGLGGSARALPPLDFSFLTPPPPPAHLNADNHGTPEERSSRQSLSSLSVSERQQQLQQLSVSRAQQLAARAQSPPAAAVAAAQQLPPACGARQLSKLKRFLTTVQQFSHDLSPLIGQHVRVLVLQLVEVNSPKKSVTKTTCLQSFLVDILGETHLPHGAGNNDDKTRVVCCEQNSELSVEEFHARLQQITNFPLRPFVIPFMKANLPLLQRELLHCAHLAQQSPDRYILTNENRLFKSDHAHSQSSANSNQEPLDVSSPSGERMETRKRTNSQEHRNEGDDKRIDMNESPSSKRARSFTPESSAFLSLERGGSPGPRSPPGLAYPISPGVGGRSVSPPGLGSRGRLEELMVVVDELRDVESSEQMEPAVPSVSMESCSSQWQQINQVMDDLKRVETTLLYIVTLLDKCKDSVSELRTQCSDSGTSVQDTSLNTTIEACLSQDRSFTGDSVKSKQTSLSTPDKTTALQSDDKSCWNCGRSSSLTCSGCGVARYCRTFCQHKDWAQHQPSCPRIAQAVKHQNLEGTASVQSSSLEKSDADKHEENSTSGSVKQECDD